jgi:hypothetical protein
MAVVGDVIDAGFLGIVGVGVWRGQNIWRHHIDAKHEREMARLEMDRMEKAIRLEIDRDKTMAEIAHMQEHPELSPPVPSSALEPGQESYLCECRAVPAPHIHAYEGGNEVFATIPVGLLERVRKGDLADLTLRNKALTQYALIKPKK